MDIDPGNYRIVAHDPAWQLAFAGERRAIAGALGLALSQVEHIGSTAVPGLGAKPIVDIMVGVDSQAHFPEAVAALHGLGYEHRGETVPGTLYNRKAGPPRVNAHLTVFEGDFWDEHLLFRDYLRTHPDRAAAYEALKRHILATIGPDRPRYNAAKQDFILETVHLARSGQ